MPETSPDHRALAARVGRAIAKVITDMIDESGGNASSVAREMGTSMSQLRRLQSGEADPRLTTLARLAELRGLTLAEFLAGLAITAQKSRRRHVATDGVSG